MKKQDKKEIVSKRTQIMSAAKKVFTEKGYHQTVVEEIASRAGIAKGTVYLYFKNKQILFTALIEEMFEEMISFISQAKEQSGSVRDKLKKLLELELAYIEKNKIFFSLIGQQMENAEHILDKSLHKKIKTRFFISHQLLGEIIQEGITQKKVKELPIPVTTMIFTSIIQSFVFMKVHNVLKKPLILEVDTILDIFFEGVGRK